MAQMSMALRYAIRGCLLVASLLLAGTGFVLLQGGHALAQCGPDEVLIGEDRNNYHCMSRRGFRARCVRQAGGRIDSEMKRCIGVGARCLEDSGFATQQALCIAGLFFNVAIAAANPANPAIPYTLGAAVVNCIGQQAQARRNWPRCQESMDGCRTTGLTRHKAEIAACMAK
jgi:hypothetical protein